METLSIVTIITIAVLGGPLATVLACVGVLSWHTQAQKSEVIGQKKLKLFHIFSIQWEELQLM